MWGVSTRFQAVAGGSRALQGPPRGSRGLRGPPDQKTQKHVLNEKCARRVQPKPRARLKFHAGWSGWTRPPTMAGGVARLFLKGSERPQAGCLGELSHLNPKSETLTLNHHYLPPPRYTLPSAGEMSLSDEFLAGLWETE